MIDVVGILPIDYSWLCIIIVAMLPLCEIHTAIPFGLSSIVWGSNVLPLWQICIYSLIGATIMALVVLLILKLLVKLLTKNKKLKKLYSRFVGWIENKFFKYSSTMHSSNVKKWWILMLFTAIPLPFSGTWTAGLLAVFFNMRFINAFSSIFVGNTIAVLITSLFCTMFYEFVDLVLVVFIIITILIIVYYALKILVEHITHKNKAKK